MIWRLILSDGKFQVFRVVITADIIQGASTLADKIWFNSEHGIREYHPFQNNLKLKDSLVACIHYNE